MTSFRNLFFVAVLAGLAAGLVMTVLQTTFAVPLILAAEEYEGLEEEAPAELAAPGVAAVPADDHDHEHEGWAPEDGFERFFYTALSNIVTGAGFGLLLVAASEFAGGILSWRQGLLWGLAGFAAFTVSPGLGLPPELPTMPAADLRARQIWWIGCVIATGAGLALIAFGNGLAFGIAGAALLVLPHLVGAPQPESHESLIPHALHHSFVVVVTVTNLVFWLLLGLATALIRPRFATDSPLAAQGRLA